MQTPGTNVTRVQDYVGGLEYRDGQLEAIYHSEGRCTPKIGGAWQYEYTLKDHLGNTRLTFSDLNADGTVANTEILQQNQYYPFGMEAERPNATVQGKKNLYQYNGKELNADFGLNWNDYGARWYDASVGRFFTVDRYSVKYNWHSTYQYASNNPIKYIDVNGDSTILVIYGSGWLNPSAKGQSHDAGEGFKRNAEARAKQLRANLKEGDDVVLVYAATEDEYINALNKNYDSGTITQVDVYSHGSSNSINLGGPSDGPEEEVPSDSDYRLVSAMK